MADNEPGASQRDDATSDADQNAAAKPAKRTRRRATTTDVPPGPQLPDDLTTGDTAGTSATGAADTGGADVGADATGTTPAKAPAKRASRARTPRKKAAASVAPVEPTTASTEVTGVPEVAPADSGTVEPGAGDGATQPSADVPRKTTRTRRRPAAKAAVPAADDAASVDSGSPSVDAPSADSSAADDTADAASAQVSTTVGLSSGAATSDAASADTASADTASANGASRVGRVVPPVPTFEPPATLFMAPEPLPVPVAPVADQPRRGRKKAADVPETVERTAPEADADATDGTDESTGTSADSAGEGSRRRRGRRGRGRGRGTSGDESNDEPTTDATEREATTDNAAGDATADSGDADDADKSADTAADDAEAGDGGTSEEVSSTRRRRRRRRRGAGSDGDAGDDESPVTDTTRPTGRSNGAGGTGVDEVRGLKGSTRLEAKRQRRRDGRDQGRRRPPVLSEAEFLARRESVERVMVVRQREDRTQIAALEDGVLVEHYVTKASSTSYAGNVYLGKVQNVLPSMEAAFVDIGKGRNAVLYAGEVNWDTAGLEGKPRKIEQALKSGDSVLVQVTKDPIGHKGARLTSQISLPGRFLVYVPEGQMTGISRKLPENERKRLKDILRRIVPEDAGVIIRTAAEGASEEELSRDVARLQAQWESITAKAAKGSAPSLLYSEPDLVIRVIRDIFNEDFTKLVVSGDEAWSTVREYVGHVSPDLVERLSKHTAETDVFATYRIDEQIMKALDRKVWLPSGGSLVIDRTEAMTVIDVNTGKFTGQGGNLEETVTRNNLEAAEEIVRQLRLRDIGGMVVVDFIDMVLESNRDLVLRRLTECLGRDRTKHQVAEVTSLGLVQMTRKRVGQGLLEAFSETCEHCKGRGLVVHTEPVDRSGSNGGSHGGGSNGGSGGSGGSAGGGSTGDGEPRGKRGRGRDGKKGKGGDTGRDTNGSEAGSSSGAGSNSGSNGSLRVPSPAEVAKVTSPSASAPDTDGAPAADVPAASAAPDDVTSTPASAASDADPTPDATVTAPSGDDSTAAPSTGQPTPETPGATDSETPAPARRKRRRAASRPSGPPPVTVS